jgi:hypothetical protein
MLPQLLREMIIEDAIASITCTREETGAACQQLLKQHQINSAAEHEAWLQRYGINHPQFQALATRRFRIEKFQGVTWGTTRKQPQVKSANAPGAPPSGTIAA